MKGSKCREAQPAEQSRVAAAEQSGVREAAEHGEALIKGELSDGGLVVNDDAAARELRWRMKALQWGASSLPSIRCCSRSPRAASTGGEGQLSVMQIGEGTGARRYISGLYHCGSRRCARCSQSIAAERVDQLSRGLDWFMHDGLGDGIGHQVLFATFTIGHSLDDLPDKLMDVLGHARSALTAGGSWNGGTRSLGDRRRFGVCGMVSTVEVTWNRNSGYHFHLHCLLLLQHPLGYSDYFALGSRLYRRWKKSLKADHFDCSLQGFSMLPLTSTIAMSDRISRYVNKADARHAAAEMLNDQGKLGRGESVGFFELLAYLCLDERLARFWFPLRKGEDASWDDSGLHVANKATGEITWSSAMGGDQQYWRVLHSIEKVMKGRRVLNYSHRCRREDSVLDSLWNRFLDHAHAAGSNDEDITRDDMGKGKLVQVISAETWQSEFVNDPSRIISLLKP